MIPADIHHIRTVCHDDHRKPRHARVPPLRCTRHHKRRLIQPALVQLLCSKLRPGGYLHFATDWEEYADEILATLMAEPLLANTVNGFAPRPAFQWYVVTRATRARASTA